MNANEIKELVAAKIAGQGSQVDIGGALPEVLNAIIDMVSDLPAPLPVVEITEGVREGTPFEISEDRAIEIKASAVLLYHNFAFVLINPTEIFDFADLQAPDAIWYSVWVSTLSKDDGGTPESYELIAVYQEGEKFYLKLVEL